MKNDLDKVRYQRRALLNLLTSKWSALAVGVLDDGPLRFGELQRVLRGVSPKVLTQTLRRLEQFGLVIRTSFPTVPPHVEYSLTALGRGAADRLARVRTWAEENLDSVPAATHEPNPGRAMLDLLANKWSALSIGVLEGGTLRFGELKRRLQGVSPKVLTQTLRRLETMRLVRRTIYPAVPLHVEYALTPLGRGAAVPLGMLCTWVEDNIDAASVRSTAGCVN